MELQRHIIADRPAPLRRYRPLWPLAALMLAELLALALALQSSVVPEPTRITRLSLFIGICVLFTGLLPAILRPNGVTNLFGCCAVLMGLLLGLTPVREFKPNTSLDILVRWPIDPIVLLRFCNMLLLPLLLFHFTNRYPLRRSLARWQIAGPYAAVIMLASAILWLPISPVRVGLTLLLLVFESFLFFGAGWNVLRATRPQAAAEQHVAQQARLLLASIALALLAMIGRAIGRRFGVDIPAELVIGAQLIFPIGIAYTILRHDLFDIDVALRRALAYAMLSVALLALYFGLTMVLTFILTLVAPPFRRLAAMFGLLGAAVLFTPLQHRTLRIIDQIFYPDRLAFQRALDDAHAMLMQVVSRAEIVQLLCAELPARIGAPGATIDEQPTETAEERSWGTVLQVGPRTLGHYRLRPRQSGMPYTAGEQARLQALAQQAALALAYAGTIEQLNDLTHDLEERVAERSAQLLSHQRALIAQEERQRLARDLHDSVKQTLFSIGLGLRAVRGLLARDVPAAQAALQTQEDLMVRAQREMGSLLTQLRTPIDDRIDLRELLAAHIRALAQLHQITIEQALGEVPPLPRAQAHELGQIASEAIHNAAKHSGAARAQVRLEARGGTIALTIADDGRGFSSPPAQPGLGLQGMRERAHDIGAQFELRSAPGQGTQVTVTLRSTQ